MPVLETLSVGGALFDQLGIKLSGFTLGGIFGAKCSGAQKEQKTKLANVIDEATTYADRQSFINSNNMETDVSPDGQSMADFYFGGRDCKHKNVSPGDQRYLDRLEGWLEGKVAQAKSTPADYEDRYNGNPGYTSEPAGTPEGQPAPVAASFGGGGLRGMLLPILLLVGIGFAFNQYQK